MAEIRDTLRLDIDEALRQVRELENALNRALGQIVVDLDTSQAVRETDRLNDELKETARATGDIADDATRIDRELRQADNSAEKLEREMRDVARAADKAADQAARIDRETKQATTSAGKLSGSLKGLALGAAAGIGISQIADALGGLVSAASDTQESVNAVNVVFGEASDTIVQFGLDTSDAVFLASEEFNSLAAVTGTLLQGFNLDAQTAADLTVQLTNRAADLASVFNTSVAEALEAINAALRGETEQIRRFTGSFSIDEVKKFGRELFNVEGALTDQQTALAAVEFIMKKTAATQGDAAATADEYANKQRQLNELWGNAQAALGEGLIPVAEEFLNILIDLAPAAEEAAPAVADFIEGAIRGTKFIGNTASAVVNLAQGIAQIPASIGQRDFNFLDQFAESARAGENAIKNLTNEVEEAGPVITSIAGDIAGAQALLNDEFAGTFDNTDRLGRSYNEMIAIQGAVVSATGELSGAQQLLNDEVENAPGAFDQYASTLDAILNPTQRLTEELSFVDRAFDDAAEAADNFRTAALKLADPVFAAAEAAADLKDAQETLAKLDPSDAAFAAARLDVFKNILEAEAAFRALGDVNLLGSPIERTLGLIELVLGDTRQEAIDLLLELKILEETDIGIGVRMLVDDSDLDRTLAEIPREIELLIRLGTPGRLPFAPDVGPIPEGSSGGGFTFAPTIIHPTTPDLAGDLQQGVMLVSTIPGLLNRVR